MTARCIESVYASTLTEVEVIVVDNGSADSASLQLQEQFSAVRIIRNAQNRGFAPAANQGLLAALGRTLVVLNNDTTVRSGALDRLRRALEEHPSAGAVAGQLLNPDGSLQPSGEPLPSLWRTLLSEFTNYRWDAHKFYWRGRSFADVHSVPMASGACLALRREALEDIGLFDEHYFFYYEDADLCRRLAERGWKILYWPTAQIVHEWGATAGQHSPGLLSQTRRGQLYYFGKYGGRGHLMILRLLLVARDLALAVLGTVLHPTARSANSRRLRACLTLAATAIMYEHPGEERIPRLDGVAR